MEKEATLDESLKEALEEIIRLKNGEDTGAYIITPDEVDVKAIRKKTGLTQVAFCNMLDIPLSTLKKWEGGHRKPERLSRAFFKVLDHNPKLVMEAFK